MATNTTETKILTAAGKSLLAQLNATEQPLVIDKMIFANIPNRPDLPQPEDGVPIEFIVHEAGVDSRGRLGPNEVIYTSTLASHIGPFEFNWTGAYCSEFDVLVTIDHHKTTPKTADEPGIAGNTMVRSVVLEYKDVAEITNITVDASSYQYDANPRMKKMDDDAAQMNQDLNGKDWFVGDGFKVSPTANANNFEIAAGRGYVSGRPVEMSFPRTVTVTDKPSYIYIDAWREGTPTGEQYTEFTFVVSSNELDDYTQMESNREVAHFVCKLAEVHADGSVVDFRPKHKPKRMWQPGGIVMDPAEVIRFVSYRDLPIDVYAPTASINNPIIMGIEPDDRFPIIPLKNNPYVYVSDHGVNNGEKDSDIIERLIEDIGNSSIIVIDQHKYKPSRPVRVGKKCHLKFINGRDYSGFNITYPLFILGEKPDETLPSNTVSGIQIENPDCYGDKLPGSRFFHYRKCSDVVMRNPRIWGMEYPITGDGSVGSYESLGCVWENPDFRYCKVGFYDPHGSFQASYMTGTGRIEANDHEGVCITSMNFDCGETIIEGNARDSNNSYEVILGGGGAFNWSGYSEALPQNKAPAIVGVMPKTTKRIQLNGMDLYAGVAPGQNRAIIDIGTMNTGSIEINGGNANDFSMSVIGDKSVSAGNLTVKIDIWDDTGNLEPDVSESINVVYSNRVKGLTLDKLTAKVRATIKQLDAMKISIGQNSKRKALVVRPESLPIQGESYDIVALSELRSVMDKPVLIEVEAVGRHDGNTPRYFKALCAVNDGGTAINSRLVDSGTESSTVELITTDGVLQVLNLNTYSHWTFYVTGLGWAYSQ